MQLLYAKAQKVTFWVKQLYDLIVLIFHQAMPQPVLWIWNKMRLYCGNLLTIDPDNESFLTAFSKT